MSTTRRVLLGLLVAFILVGAFAIVMNVRAGHRADARSRCVTYDLEGLPLPPSCLEDQSWRVR